MMTPERPATPQQRIRICADHLGYGYDGNCKLCIERNECLLSERPALPRQPVTITRLLDGTLGAAGERPAPPPAKTQWLVDPPRGTKASRVFDDLEAARRYANECPPHTRIVERPAAEGPQPIDMREDYWREFDAGWRSVWKHPSDSSVPSAPASTGEQPDFARCLRCVSHELTRDVCWYAGRCVRQATASPATAADYIERDRLGRLVREAWVSWARTQPNPKPSWLVPYDDLSEADKEADRQIGEAVAADRGRHSAVDYTERARKLLRKLHCWRLLYHNARPIDDPDVGQIAAALNEVASERDAAAIRAFGDTRARLREPDVREAVLAMVMEKKRGGRPPSAIELVDAALTKIAEMLA